MAAGMTYFPIATATGTGSSGTITFSSISGSYTDLVLVANGKINTGTANLQVQFNGDTTSLYSTTIMYGDGTDDLADRSSSAAVTYVCWAAYWNPTDIATTIINIQNYSNANTYKTLITRNNAVSYGTEAMVGLWRSTAAINSITLKTSSNNFTTASTFTLYGIVAA
jgi:hypothetical protein